MAFGVRVSGGAGTYAVLVVPLDSVQNGGRLSYHAVNIKERSRSHCYVPPNISVRHNDTLTSDDA